MSTHMQTAFAALTELQTVTTTIEPLHPCRLPGRWDHLIARGMGPPWRVIEDARRGGLGQLGGSGALAVGRSFDDEGVGGCGQSVDCRLGQERVGGHGQPFGRFSVGGDDGGLGAVAFDDDFVEVAGFGGAEGS